MICEAVFKGYVHATAGTLAAVMDAYNVMRWCATGNTRNAVNVVIYTALTIHEWRQVRHHFSQPRTVPGWDRPLSADDV